MPNKVTLAIGDNNSATFVNAVRMNATQVLCPVFPRIDSL